MQAFSPVARPWTCNFVMAGGSVATPRRVMLIVRFSLYAKLCYTILTFPPQHCLSEAVPRLPVAGGGANHIGRKYIALFMVASYFHLSVGRGLPGPVQAAFHATGPCFGVHRQYANADLTDDPVTLVTGCNTRRKSDWD